MFFGLFSLDFLFHMYFVYVALDAAVPAAVSDEDLFYKRCSCGLRLAE